MKPRHDLPHEAVTVFDQSSGITRRKFIRASGGATIATIIAMQLSAERLRAEVPSPTAGGSDEDGEPDTYVAKGAAENPQYVTVRSDPGEIRVAKSDDPTDYEVFPVKWAFVMDVDFVDNAGMTKPKTRCAKIKVSEVKLLLEGWPKPVDRGSGPDFQPQSRDVVGPTHQRGVTISDASVLEPQQDLKLSSSSILGQEEASASNISIFITGEVTPEDDAATKRIDWVVNPVINLNISTLSNMIKNEIEAGIGEDYEVTVSLPNPDTNKHNCSQSFSATVTQEETASGSGCSL
jgi:hypothetical protein